MAMVEFEGREVEVFAWAESMPEDGGEVRWNAITRTAHWSQVARRRKTRERAIRAAIRLEREGGLQGGKR